MMMTTCVSSALQCIIMITVMMIILICRCPQCTAEQAGYLVSTDPAAGPEAKVDWLASNFIIIGLVGPTLTVFIASQDDCDDFSDNFQPHIFHRTCIVCQRIQASTFVDAVTQVFHDHDQNMIMMIINSDQNDQINDHQCLCSQLERSW